MLIYHFKKLCKCCDTLVNRMEFIVKIKHKYFVNYSKINKQFNYSVFVQRGFISVMLMQCSLGLKIYNVKLF